MKRLTQWLAEGVAGIATDLEEKYTAEELIDILAKRLAAYEDTGLEPEEIEGILERGTPLERGTAELMKTYLSIGSVDHLRDLAQAEKDGRLVVLPEIEDNSVLVATIDGTEMIKTWSDG